MRYDETQLRFPTADEIAALALEAFFTVLPHVSISELRSALAGGALDHDLSSQLDIMPAAHGRLCILLDCNLFNIELSLLPSCFDRSKDQEDQAVRKCLEIMDVMSKVTSIGEERFFFLKSCSVAIWDCGTAEHCDRWLDVVNTWNSSR